MSNKVFIALSLFLFLLISNGNANSPFFIFSENTPSPTMEKNIDEIHFYGQSNSSCYIVAVSSPYDIYIKDFHFKMREYIKDTKDTTLSSFCGVILTNGTYSSFGLGGQSESNKIGNLRYVYFKFGRFNYTYDNRYIFHDFSGFFSGVGLWDHNHTLPAGTWYFIFTGGVFDLKQDDIIVETKVWINFSENCKDLKIKTSEGGKIYALWYGEFDANLIISKFGTFEMMVNGKARFHVNDTFIYTFWSWPAAQGFWRIKWIKPNSEIDKLNMIIIREYHFPDIGGSCIAGIGGSGDYELITSYLDYRPLLFGKHIYAYPVYFVGLDVKLPEFE